MTIADWDRVVAIATSMNKADALTMPQRTALDASYRTLVEQCLPPLLHAQAQLRTLL